jgi:hypothetical protein
MTTFDERESAYENKFKLDKELQFKASGRRNRLLGQWAAGLLGIPAAEAEAYAKTVIRADFEKPGDDDVLAKIMADFKAKGIEMSEHRLRKQMDDLMHTARQQIMTETKS